MGIKKLPIYRELFYTHHGHKLRFPQGKKAQFVTEGIILFKIKFIFCKVKLHEADNTGFAP
jgi:hypothetical protein